MPIQYRVPYEISINAQETASNRQISTVLHYRGGIANTPPAYASNIVGSDLAVALAAFRGTWRTHILPQLHTRYVISEYVMKAILGWSLGSAPRPVLNASNTSPIVIVTDGAHNLLTGQRVTVSGVLGNTNANGTFYITVTGSNAFELDGSVGNGAYGGQGQWTVGLEQQRLLYGEQSTLIGVPGVDVGQLSGEMLPVFSTWSTYKRASAAGRNFRGGIRISPFPETQQENGRFTQAVITAHQTAMDNLLAETLASGAPAGNGGVLQLVVFSKSRAIQEVTPFVSSETIVSNVIGMFSQPNMGSMVRRKPKLTSPVQQP